LTNLGFEHISEKKKSDSQKIKSVIPPNPQPLFNFLSEFLKPRHPPESLKAEHQKQNFLFHLREILPRAKSENVRKFFVSGVRRVREAGGGAFSPSFCLENKFEQML